jgi:uncharacterized protein
LHKKLGHYLQVFLPQFWGIKPLIRILLIISGLLCGGVIHQVNADNTERSSFNDLIEFNPAFDEQVTHQKQSDTSQSNTFSNTHSATRSRRNKIAIIIDDMGYNYAQGLEAIALPGAITYAIIPHSPKAQFFAEEAQKQHKEIMLHAPMSNVHNIPLGENGLYETMDEVRFKRALELSLDSLPSVSGVNNHMGSLLTQKALPMEWVMQALQKRQLYFIDSRTTSNSIAWQTAQAFNIPSLKRDVFLDHTPTSEMIGEQFDKLITIAKEKGYAVAIAHPYPETIAYLKQQLPNLAQHNIDLVSASQLVNRYSPNIMSSKHTKYTQNVIRVTK